jgi:hypothetical protein
MSFDELINEAVSSVKSRRGIFGPKPLHAQKKMSRVKLLLATLNTVLKIAREESWRFLDINELGEKDGPRKR